MLQLQAVLMAMVCVVGAMWLSVVCAASGDHANTHDHDLTMLMIVAHVATKKHLLQWYQ